MDGQLDEAQYYNASFIDEYSNNFIQLKVRIEPGVYTIYIMQYTMVVGEGEWGEKMKVRGKIKWLKKRNRREFCIMNRVKKIKRANLV